MKIDKEERKASRFRRAERKYKKKRNEKETNDYEMLILKRLFEVLKVRAIK